MSNIQTPTGELTLAPKKRYQHNNINRHNTQE